MGAHLRHPLLPQSAATRPASALAAGFTLVELIIVVTIVGVLAGIGVPAFSNLIAIQRASSAATDLYVALATARSEAIKRNVDVTIAQKSGGWTNGWTIVDPADTSKKILEANGLSGAAITASLTSIVYQSSGRVSGSTRPAFAITMTSGTSTQSKNVCVDLSGRPFVSTSSCP
jgi:type IV fimbrial biogenesis protein FimT